MKKIFALLIALMMVFSLVACDLGNTEDPNKDNPGTSQSGENNNGGEENKGGKDLYDVTDAQISVADGLDISVIPAIAKKGVGTLKSGGYDLKKASLSSYIAQCEITYFDVAKEGYDALLDYYESNGATVEETFGSVDVIFDWGKIVPVYHADQNQMSLTVYIKTGSNEQASDKIAVKTVQKAYSNNDGYGFLSIDFARLNGESFTFVTGLELPATNSGFSITAGFEILHISVHETGITIAYAANSDNYSQVDRVTYTPPAEPIVKTSDGESFDSFDYEVPYYNNDLY